MLRAGPLSFFVAHRGDALDASLALPQTIVLFAYLNSAEFRVSALVDVAGAQPFDAYVAGNARLTPALHAYILHSNHLFRL